MDERLYDERYKKLRAEVIKRDGGKCQFPNCKRRGKVEVHHIIRWADCYELRYEPSNCICLCKRHHWFIRNNEQSYIQTFRDIVRRNNGCDY